MENKLVESGLTKMFKKMLNEADGIPTLDAQDAKLIADMVKGLASVPYAGYRTNDKFIKGKGDELSRIRIDLMEYLEQNSNYKFVATGNSWKLTKK